MKVEEQFYQELAQGIIVAGGDRFDAQSARELAIQVWEELKRIGEDAFPCMVVYGDDLRFIYQWDEEPQVVTVLLWDDKMWRDMARIPVPPALASQ